MTDKNIMCDKVLMFILAARDPDRKGSLYISDQTNGNRKLEKFVLTILHCDIVWKYLDLICGKADEQPTMFN